MPKTFDIVCFSHLRWDFVYQRPQHLLSRCAREHRVFFIEEPVLTSTLPSLHMAESAEGVYVVRPELPQGLDDEEVAAMQRSMLASLFATHSITEYALWYYTPMAIAFTKDLLPLATIYDCMDELSMFDGAHPMLPGYEQELFRRADLVFTGGQSLYMSKRAQHPNVHAFPSSVESAHFGQARLGMLDPADQAALPHPRIGFYGVIDERMDLEMLEAIAQARQDWQLILLGPVAKIEPDRLPRGQNIHYLGGKAYAELPAYLANWDVAMMPFARNASTRFISPTKTLEYLAAGRPVVSTSIADVVEPYGRLGLVEVADGVAEFVAAVERLLEGASAGRCAADAYLATTSWDRTWDAMHALVRSTVEARTLPTLRLKVEPTKAIGSKKIVLQRAGGVLAVPAGRSELGEWEASGEDE